MLELNKVLLIGNLTRDPELKYTASGTAVASLGLACNRRWKDRNGEQREDTVFVDIDAWANTAEFCSKYLKKGRRIFVEGRLKFDQWETQDGARRSKLGVTADRIQFADPPPSSQGGGGGYDRSESRGAAPQRQAPPQQQNNRNANHDDSPPFDEGAEDPSTADDLPF